VWAVGGATPLALRERVGGYFRKHATSRSNPNVNRLDDPALLALPHPVRVDAALGEPPEVGALRALGLLEQLQPYLADTRVTTEWLLNRVPGMAQAAIASMGAPVLGAIEREPSRLDPPGAGQCERGLRGGEGEAVGAAGGERAIA
jgi:hypothetical protein